MRRARRVETVPLMVRLPPDLHQELVDTATADTRSLNGEVIVLLKEALERRAELAKKSAEQP